MGMREGYARTRIFSIDNMAQAVMAGKSKRQSLGGLDIMHNKKWSDLEDHGPSVHAEEFALHKSSTGNRCPDLRQQM